MNNCRSKADYFVKSPSSLTILLVSLLAFYFEITTSLQLPMKKDGITISPPSLVDGNCNMEINSIGTGTYRTAGRYRAVQLPETVIVGYANWNECDDKIVEAVRNGVNVVMWFAINLDVDTTTGLPLITNGPDMDCVADVIAQISALNLDTIHLISIGGWNSPHPNTANSPEDTYTHWDYWNRNIAARPDKGFHGFDGFDWDIEGNDDFDSKFNHFTCACLDLMGRVSQLAKEKGKYFVTMAPAESYLDPTRHGFDRSLLHEYDEWVSIVPGFRYHGLNTYAYLIDRYGYYSVCNDDPSSEVLIDEKQQHHTFDLVVLQLYEGYSHAEYNTTQLKEYSTDGVLTECNQPTDEYIVNVVRSLIRGWDIDYTQDIELNYPHKNTMRIDKTKIVIGLANGWAGDGKFFLAYPEDIEKAYASLLATDEEPRGFAFWNILDEGRSSLRRPHQPVWMATGLNKFLNIRSN